jgi:2-polyprenyl-3-methyl-5-hydroxy-6-metoxy-1,4-benzoquinol methylase
MPDEAELAAYYRDRYRLAYQFARRAPPRRHLTRTRAGGARRVALLARALPAGSRVLDFGSGSGEFLAAGAPAGWDMEGVEPGKTFGGHARAVGLVVHDELAAALGLFDAITAHHVLEHLRDPLAALRKMMLLLKPEGLLYLSVPDMGPSPKPAFDRLHFAHVHGFVPATLDLLAARVGLAADPRFERHGTTMVCSRQPSELQPDPTLADSVLAGFIPTLMGGDSRGGFPDAAMM